MIEAGALDGADAFLMFHYAGDESFGMTVHEGQASSMIGGMEIHIHGKSSHWCEAEKGIDAIYGASVAAKAVCELNKYHCRSCSDEREHTRVQRRRLSQTSKRSERYSEKNRRRDRDRDSRERTETASSSFCK